MWVLGCAGNGAAPHSAGMPYYFLGDSCFANLTRWFAEGLGPPLIRDVCTAAPRLTKYVSCRLLPIRVTRQPFARLSFPRNL